MKNIYTFVSYLLFRFFIQKTICLELNIGKITDYSSGSSQVTVKKTTELQNLYTHKFSNPVLLKDIYNGKERLYFDQLLVSDQLLLSASVVWSFETPSIIQLNLEQSSVLLINEKESLDVQAIFSKKLVTNIKPRIHSDIDAIVDINLSNIADYDSNNSKVYVTNLKFSEDRFKRYTLRNYNLESTRLGKILYNNTELTTKFENDVKRSTESNLDIPYKNNVYSIQVYAYNNFPLLIEFLYTFDKRQFYGYTPEEKWHHVYFPAFHDPSFLDFLYDKLNYYACKNGFKYTIDINQKTDTSDRSYQIDNYCIGSEGVETVVNNLKLASYINEINIERVHRCFEHTPSNDNKFFIDHLMYNSTVIQLKDTPKVTKSVRVYQHLNHEPYLIVFVDDLDKLYHYKFQNGKWKNDDNIILLLDKTSLYEKSLQKILNTIAHVYMSLNTDDKKIIRDRWDYNANDDAIKTLPDNLSILTITNAQVTISTIHNDKIKKHNIIQKLELDFYYFNSYSTYVQYSGDLTNNLTITAKSNYGIDIIKFYYINIMTLPEGSYVHRIEYIRDTPTDEVTIHLHTNTLFVYSYVRKYDDWYKPFHFIGITRIKPFNHSNEVDKYFEKIRALNRKNFFITRIFKLS
ncbi:conserved hypothetical protein [Theileria orientalis strain Shintoku]|uniref:Uncharacterized protein n=1 Tax=Theileria orientalis strain Shintoku TaxID=869250 RepID=J4C7W1_THEOR|nr:conserved hypothetical protein [Theileria orientalis strain Shintoku]BAM39728.1 conserved hypothetical protein [Theileria orientalis strain Shintoku]|eukprot:XP_009690029.1 conserved hypothetical protein [Theileria orientalis strain Shintoku]